MKVKVGISNRHVHLTEVDLKKLFGPNAELEILKPISQPGQFSSTYQVTLINGERQIEKVRVVGPIRKYTQVEISKTDSYKLKLNPPIRDSGDLEGSSPITLQGPNGIVNLDKGCIIANRHIHITPEEMIKYGFKNLKKVQIKISGEKGAILDNVYFKIDKNFAFEFQVDTDDANACLLKTNDEVEIMKK